MIVVGVDPGTLHMGWGVLRAQGNRITHLGHGVIDAPSSRSLAARLLHLETHFLHLLEAHGPQVGVVESLFFHKDPQAAAKLGHARGMVLLSLARRNVPVFEYAPARVKSTVAGHGRAAKSQIVRMVTTLLSLPEPPREDAADALAIALTYVRRAPVEEALARHTETAGRPRGRSSRKGVAVSRVR